MGDAIGAPTRPYRTDHDLDPSSPKPCRSIRTLPGREDHLREKLSAGRLSEKDYPSLLKSARDISNDRDSDDIRPFAPVESSIKRWPESILSTGHSRKDKALRRQVELGDSTGRQRPQLEPVLSRVHTARLRYTRPVRPSPCTSASHRAAAAGRKRRLESQVRQEVREAIDELDRFERRQLQMLRQAKQKTDQAEVDKHLSGVFLDVSTIPQQLRLQEQHDDQVAVDRLLRGMIRDAAAAASGDAGQWR